jgi:hypothetical protein
MNLMKTFFAYSIFILMTALLTGCMTAPNGKPRTDLWGEPAAVSAATRTLVIDHYVPYVNVTGGQVVRFVVGDQAFAWNFDSAQEVPPFDLRLIAPPGVMLDHPVTVYVARNPLYMQHHGPFWSPWPP